MKRFGTFLALVFLCAAGLSAQTYMDILGTPKGILQKTDTANMATYEGFASQHIGRTVMSAPFKWFKYRSFGTFGPALIFPLDGAVDNVVLQIWFGTNQPSRSVKIVYLSSDAPPDPYTPGTAWTIIGGGSEAFGTVTTLSTMQSLTSASFVQKVAEALRNRQTFYLGFISNQEASDSVTNMVASINLHVGYHRVPSPYFIKNIFNAGRIKVNGVDTVSGTRYSWLDGESHPLEAIDQYSEPYNYLWHTDGMSDSKSNWWKARPNDIARQIGGATYRAFTYVASKYDSAASIIAELKKVCNLYLRLQSDAGDSQNQGLLTTVVESDTVTITAPATMTVNGSTYPFTNWADGSTQRIHQVSVTDHTVEIAMYESPYPSGTLSQNTIWTVAKTLAGDVYVPTGVSLTIKSSSSVNLNGHMLLSTGGTITKETGVTITGVRAYLKHEDLTIKGMHSVIQTACSNAADYDIVDIQSGTFTENLSISNRWGAAIHGQSSSLTHIAGGITANSCVYLAIENLSTTRPIILNTCDGSEVSYASLNDGWYLTDNALQAINCNDFSVYGGTVMSNFAGGLYFYNTTAYSYISQMINNMFHNALGAQNAYALLDWSLICQRRQRAYDLEASTGAYVESSDGTYTNGTPRILGNAYATDGVYTCPPSKTDLAEGDTPGLTSATQDPAFSAFRASVKEYWDLKKKYDDTKKATGSYDKDQYRADHVAFAGKLKIFMDANPGSAFASTALAVAAHTYRRLRDFEGMNAFLQEIVGDGKLQNAQPGYASLGVLAKRHMIDAHRSLKDYDGALKIADELLKQESSDTAFVCDVLYTKGLLYAHEMQKPNEAIECFTSLVTGFPETPLLNAARNELLLLGVDLGSLDKPKKKEPVVTDFSCQSYPNPFNPSTTVSFQLPADSYVSLKIYNVIGQEVEDLASGYHKAGRYGVLWDASRTGVASGVYFVRFVATSELGEIKHSEVNKILLMK